METYLRRTDLEDGLYQVTTSYLCAGFEVENGNIIACAPILRKKLAYWITIAKKVADGDWRDNWRNVDA